MSRKNAKNFCDQNSAVEEFSSRDALKLSLVDIIKQIFPVERLVLPQTPIQKRSITFNLLEKFIIPRSM